MMPSGVDVDLLAVAAGGDLRGHVVDGADALGLAAAAAGRDELGQAVVADLDDAVLEEDVARLQVAVDDAVVVQVGRRRRRCRANHCQATFERQAVGVAVDDVVRATRRRRTP